MEVILLQDVRKIGRRDEVRTVADGYGRNYLLARGLAILATADNQAKLNRRLQTQATESKIQQNLLKEQLATLTTKALVIKAKANAQGHLFAGLKAEDIATLLAKQGQLNLAPEAIQLPQAIKTTGTHQLEIKNGPVTGTLTIEVEAA